MRKNVTVALLLATFLAAIEGTVVSVATPVIASELNGAALVSWVFAAFLLFTAVSTPIYGKVADLFGRKRVLLFGIGLFTLASLLCGLATSMEQLIVFRALQGLGAGAVLPISMTIIGDMYKYEERGKIQGILSAVWGVSGVLGPVIGGFLVETLSWRYVFLLNVPFALLSFIMIVTFYKETVAETTERIDIKGALLFAGGTTAFLYALITFSETNILTLPVVVSAVLSLILLVSFFMSERRAKTPLLPLELLKQPIIASINGAVFFAAWVLVSMSAYIPIWAQAVLGKSATEAGFMLMPLSVAWTFTSIIGGRTLGAASPRRRAVFGMGLLLVGTVILTLMTPSSSDVWVYLAVAIIGVGFGLSQPMFIVVLQTVVSYRERGTATAANSFLSTVGQTLGVAVFGAMFNFIVLSGFRNDETLSGASLESFFNRAASATLDESVRLQGEQLIASGLNSVFVGAALAAFIALLIALRLPARPPEPSRDA
ncbi:MFS transporter [Exiguobacterium sp. SH3S2]|nr:MULTISPECIES: MDR family MFS transporter [unclassified Exiguobacterium]TCI26930.1 MFS transporter [Exiguobacterium sp. SH5S4]TCI44434.1 MFS transporter [Exiguobacterium sp. SH3S3]TCI56873.1 MFS transporter [Exiguobacterium sp. SH5S13]TCI59992.1 MFS transporter [Exiguobacterium sp. SH3S2]